jgi:hypothetical protein
LAIVVIIAVAAVAIYFLTLPPPAGVPQIKGTVTDEDTGLPIEGVKVTVDSLQVFTDSSGVYLINVTDLETYTVKAEKAGYIPQTKTVDVTAKKTYTVSFVMKPTEVEVYLNPTEIMLNASEVSVGYRFNVSVSVAEVEDLFGYQVALYYNSSVINVTNAWRPIWNSSYVFYGKTAEPLNASEYFGDWGNYLIGSTLLAGTESFTGDGLLAVFEFEIVASPAVDLTSDLIVSYIPAGGTFETRLKDSSNNVIYFTATDGNYGYTS